MMKKHTKQQFLLNELNSLFEKCEFSNKKELTRFLLDHDPSLVDHADEHGFDKLYDRIRQQMSNPPKKSAVFAKYIEILRDHHPKLKKDMIYPDIETVFDNDTDRLRFETMMQKIHIDIE